MQEDNIEKVYCPNCSAEVEYEIHSKAECEECNTYFNGRKAPQVVELETKIGLIKHVILMFFLVILYPLSAAYRLLFLLWIFLWAYIINPLLGRNR